MAHIVDYIRRRGIIHLLVVIYQYKIDIGIRYLLNLIFKRMPLKNYIVIESHNDFDNNGGAFYDYLVSNHYNRNYKIIWILKNRLVTELPENVLAFCSYRPSMRKDYYLVRAKYFTADNDIFEKIRSDQRSYYFTHGAFSLKNVHGLIDIPHSVDYVLSPSSNADKIESSQFNMEYPSRRYLHLGFPANDVLFNGSSNELKKITNLVYNKVILWMPTFRRGGGFQRNDSTVSEPLGVPLITSGEMLKQLDSDLHRKNVLLVIKLHPKQAIAPDEIIQDTENIKVLTGEKIKQLSIDNYRLMKCADALISDYSSVVYSYLLLNRPIGFVFSDLKGYKLGLINADTNFLTPGRKILSFSDFKRFIDNVVDDKDDYIEKRTEVLSWLYEYVDGDSSKRIAEYMGLSKS